MGTLRFSLEVFLVGSLIQCASQPKGYFLKVLIKQGTVVETLFKYRRVLLTKLHTYVHTHVHTT